MILKYLYFEKNQFKYIFILVLFKIKHIKYKICNEINFYS